MAPTPKPDSETVVVEGVPFLIYFDVWAGSKGSHDSLGGVPGAGPPLEPDEPADLEIVAVYVEGWDMTEMLSACVFDRIRAELDVSLAGRGE
jgi:hypothetical protein